MALMTKTQTQMTAKAMAPTVRIKIKMMAKAVVSMMRFQTMMNVKRVIRNLTKIHKTKRRSCYECLKNSEKSKNVYRKKLKSIKRHSETFSKLRKLSQTMTM